MVQFVDILSIVQFIYFYENMSHLLYLKFNLNYYTNEHRSIVKDGGISSNVQLIIHVTITF